MNTSQQPFANGFIYTFRGAGATQFQKLVTKAIAHFTTLDPDSAAVVIVQVPCPDNARHHETFLEYDGYLKPAGERVIDLILKHLGPIRADHQAVWGGKRGWALFHVSAATKDYSAHELLEFGDQLKNALEAAGTTRQEIEAAFAGRTI